MAKRSLDLNTAEAELIRTALEIEVDTLNGLIAAQETPSRDRYYAQTNRRQFNELIRRLDPLTYDDKADSDEGSSPSEY